MLTKKKKLLNALSMDDYRTALKIAKDFHYELTKEQNSIITRAHEMINNRSFYEQLGFNLEEEWNKAVEILDNVFKR